MLLMFPTGTLDRNQLLFAVAAYNFANFMVKEFDLSFEEAGPMSMLTIHGFFNLDEILHYYKMIYGADGYATALDKNVAILPISDDNYETLMRGKTLEEYVEFFQENFGEAVPELAARWKARMAAEQIKEEEAKAEEAEAQDSENIPEEKPEQPSFDRKVRKNPGIRQKGRVKLKTMGCDAVMIGHETIDLRYVEQLVDSEQLNTLGQIVRFLEEEIFDGRKTLGQAIEQVENVLDKKGLAGVCEGNTVPGNLARPRIQEIYACMNRYRKLGTDRKERG